ncbi:MAG: ATP-binding cassette domain-containing protein [Actinomycetota bacterium]|nr:ATP-binding cassette domain-containing protein [Actinomycetota bacterium]
MTVIVGHNGAGKSSLLRAIAGSARVSSGRISLGDIELGRMRPGARARMIGVVPDHPEYNTTAELTLEEHLSLAVARGQRRLRSALSRGRRDEIRELARQAGLGLDQRLGVTVGTLSAGQRQATALVMALATSPALLLLDEYTANLDPWAAQRLRAVTALLSRESGATASW